MKNTNKNQNGFTGVEAILIILVIGIIGFVGWYVWNNKNNLKNVNVPKISSPSSTAKPSVKKTPSNSYAGWTKVNISKVDLSIEYPSDWTVHTQYSPANGDGFWLYQNTYKSGSKYLAIFLSPVTQAQIPGATSGPSNHGNTSVASFTFNRQHAYIVDDSQNKTYYLSSCAAPSLCFFPSKINSSDSLELSLIYGTPGQGGGPSPVLPNNPTQLNEAVKIMESLSY